MNQKYVDGKANRRSLQNATSCRIPEAYVICLRFQGDEDCVIRRGRWVMVELCPVYFWDKIIVLSEQ